MARLRIRAAMADASINQLTGPVSSEGHRTAILGLDFGTAFTKAVVLFEQRYYAVDWSGTVRSEEHTSELQSLMRISYAVFCLKKKKTQQQTHQTRMHQPSEHT